MTLEFENKIPNTGITAKPVGDWSSCFLNKPDTICGSGNKYKAKMCLALDGSPLPVNFCESSGLMKKDACSVECKSLDNISNWSQWSACSRSCGNGIQTRHIRSWESPGLEKTSTRSCFSSCKYYSWRIDLWGECEINEICGKGIQKKNIECTISEDGQSRVINDPNGFKLCEEQSILTKEMLSSRECYVACENGKTRLILLEYI